MGHDPSAKNYKKEVLLEVVKEGLPIGVYFWEQGSAVYEEQAIDVVISFNDEVKCHWVEKMCNKFKNHHDSGRCNRHHLSIQES